MASVDGRKFIFGYDFGLIATKVVLVVDPVLSIYIYILFYSIFNNN